MARICSAMLAQGNAPSPSKGTFCVTVHDKVGHTAPAGTYLEHDIVAKIIIFPQIDSNYTVITCQYTV